MIVILMMVITTFVSFDFGTLLDINFYYLPTGKASLGKSKVAEFSPEEKQLDLPVVPVNSS